MKKTVLIIAAGIFVLAAAGNVYAMKVEMSPEEACRNLGFYAGEVNYLTLGEVDEQKKSLIDAIKASIKDKTIDGYASEIGKAESDKKKIKESAAALTSYLEDLGPRDIFTCNTSKARRVFRFSETEKLTVEKVLKAHETAKQNLNYNQVLYLDTLLRYLISDIYASEKPIYKPTPTLLRKILGFFTRIELKLGSDNDVHSIVKPNYYRIFGALTVGSTAVGAYLFRNKIYSYLKPVLGYASSRTPNFINRYFAK